MSRAAAVPATSHGYAILFKLNMAVLAISGMAQMPIFKRYYIADVPGLGWTADFHFTHLMHYAAACVLLFMLSYEASGYLVKRLALGKISTSGRARIVIYAVIIVTGFMRVMKNLPEISFSPSATMLIDWVHLGMALLLGLFSFVALLAGRSAYLKKG